MQISVALTPKLLRDPRRQAIAVVDVLRATTSIIAMHENGLLRAIVSENIQQARKLARANFSLLCGEVKAKPPAGFDYGNSPAEFAGLSFKGKSAVVMTTNGTRALAAAAESPFAVAAALTNRRAAAETLVAHAARHELDVAVVCAGTERGLAFSLEDTVAAGAIVEAAMSADAALHMTDSSWAALHLWRWYRGDAMRAFRQSKHGRSLTALGFERDLKFAARTDVSTVVPRLYDDGGTLVTRSAARRSRATGAR
jgi:2-phosphosulfolactate phosphatase